MIAQLVILLRLWRIIRVVNGIILSSKSQNDNALHEAKGEPQKAIPLKVRSAGVGVSSVHVGVSSVHVGVRSVHVRVTCVHVGVRSVGVRCVHVGVKSVCVGVRSVVVGVWVWKCVCIC